jgi:hypothetical protein
MRMCNRNNASEGGRSGGSIGAGGSSGNGDGAKKTSNTLKLGSDGKPIRCTNCGKKDHLGKDYWSKPKKGKVHVAQTEEEENSLFLVSTVIGTPFILDQ